MAKLFFPSPSVILHGQQNICVSPELFSTQTQNCGGCSFLFPNVYTSFLQNPCGRNQNYFDSVAFLLLLWNALKVKVKVKVKSLSCVRLFATPWTIAHQVPPSMGLSRQEYWSELPFPSPGESSRPRDRTQVSCIVGRHFNLCTTREAHEMP